MFGKNGANDFSIEDIENFLNGEGTATPAVNESADDESTDNESSSATQPTEKKSENETQAFAHRLKEATTKARNEERESIAKSLGYESYADMQKRRETDMLKEKGLDPEEVSPVVDELVKKRLEEDPRLKELDSYRQQKVNEWAKKELAELKELTGGKVSTFDDVPKNVLELWKSKGSLTAAYMELNGAALIREMRSGIASEQSKGSTSHLSSPNGSPAVPSNKRPLTQQERDMYKLFNPEVTEEQLSKMTKDK